MLSFLVVFGTLWGILKQYNHDVDYSNLNPSDKVIFWVSCSEKWSGNHVYLFIWRNSMLCARLKESNIPFVVTENSCGYHWCWDTNNNALSSFHSWEPKCTVLKIRVVQVVIESKILLGKRFLQVCAWIYRFGFYMQALFAHAGGMFICVSKNAYPSSTILPPALSNWHIEDGPSEY